MKIHVQSDDHCIRLVLPTNLIFSPVIAHVACFALRFTPDDVPSISPDALKALFAEFRRIKKRYGTWQMVDMETSSGEIVKIIL